MTAKNDETNASDEPFPSAPKGYESWLEYAVAMFGAEAMSDRPFDNTDWTTRRQLQARVWADFNALRSRAGLPALELKGLILTSMQGNSTVLPATAQETDEKAEKAPPWVPSEHKRRSLLDLMDKMPRTDEIEFDPLPVVIEARKVDFD